jgi:hypothetical protein
MKKLAIALLTDTLPPCNPGSTRKTSCPATVGERGKLICYFGPTAASCIIGMMMITVTMMPMMTRQWR